MSQDFPKQIWFLWLQGLNQAPYLVKKCFFSWQKHNPDWKITFLESSNLHEYVDLKKIMAKNRANISNPALSDIVRIKLLNRYGGVWVDATCFCSKPLDEWLFDYVENGFFAFQAPAIDRPISSWFLASKPQALIAKVYEEKVEHYWTKNNFSNQNNKRGKFVKKHIEPRMKRHHYTSTSFYFYKMLMHKLNVYPYFWFHYLFASVLKDPQCYNLWASTKKCSSDIPHILQTYGLFKPLTDTVKQNIDSEQFPLYKLLWKYPAQNYVEGTVLYYLLER
jgi:hypothetical protein